MKNKLYKKLFALTLSLALVFVLAACGTANGQSETTNSTASAQGEANHESAPATTTDTEAASSQEQTTPAPSQSASSTPPSNDNSQLTRDEALNIALKDAGLKKSQVYDLEVELDKDRGALHYDVSFEYNKADYDYEIDAKSGKILSVEKPNATSNNVKLSKAEAKSKALKHAGVKESEISRYQIELEKDDGVWKYELSFNVGNTEYEYTINAESGKILHSEKEFDD